MENKTKLLYAGLTGLVLSDIIPTPGDYLYFKMLRKWREKWSKGEFTAKQFWIRQGLGYYLFNSGWWLIVGTAIYFTPGNFRKKLKIGLAIAGSGLVFSIFIKNIRQDEKENIQKINIIKENLYKNI